MSYKVNIFYPFDKGFFGKTLNAPRTLEPVGTPSKLKMDSVDDLVKHFKDECRRVALERSPHFDKLETKELPSEVEIPDISKFL